MSDWKRCTLEDLGEIVGGATPSTKNESYYGGNIAWITPKDLSTFQGRFISHGERNITAEGLKNSSARLMPPHSVLFTSRATIGYVAIAENEVCTNQGFKSIVPNSSTDYLFLYYLLVHNCDRIENMGSGTTFKEISGSVMKQIEVFVPSDKAEQQAIAKTLGLLDAKIENNTKINHHFQLGIFFPHAQSDTNHFYTALGKLAIKWVQAKIGQISYPIAPSLLRISSSNSWERLNISESSPVNRVIFSSKGSPSSSCASIPT
jgi:type I restriction enzyme S subunit